MTNQTDLDDEGNDPRALRLIELTDEFVQNLHDRAGSSHAVEVTTEDVPIDGREIGQGPERYIEEQLVRPVAEGVLGYDYRPQVKGYDGLDGRMPDFGVVNADCVIMGELKKPNRIEKARAESHEYLQLAEARPAAGISTDGWTWILHLVEALDGRPEYYAHAPLRPIIKELGMAERQSKFSANRRELREAAAGFVQRFEREAIVNAVQNGGS